MQFVIMGLPVDMVRTLFSIAIKKQDSFLLLILFLFVFVFVFVLFFSVNIPSYQCMVCKDNIE